MILQQNYYTTGTLHTYLKLSDMKKRQFYSGSLLKNNIHNLNYHNLKIYVIVRSDWWKFVQSSNSHCFIRLTWYIWLVYYIFGHHLFINKDPLYTVHYTALLFILESIQWHPKDCFKFRWIAVNGSKYFTWNKITLLEKRWTLWKKKKMVALIWV